MRRIALLALFALAGCGGDSTAPYAGLTGKYGLFTPAQHPVWVVSWPPESSQSGCAQLANDVITFTTSTTFTEDRDYIPLSTPFTVTKASFTGTYSPVAGSNQIVLHVDGGSDTMTLQTFQGADAIIGDRTFPLHGSCQSGGPYSFTLTKF
jgi:hypothetical protein